MRTLLNMILTMVSFFLSVYIALELLSPMNGFFDGIIITAFVSMLTTISFAVIDKYIGDDRGADANRQVITVSHSACSTPIVTPLEYHKSKIVEAVRAEAPHEAKKVLALLFYKKLGEELYIMKLNGTYAPEIEQQLNKWIDVELRKLASR